MMGKLNKCLESYLNRLLVLFISGKKPLIYQVAELNIKQLLVVGHTQQYCSINVETSYCNLLIMSYITSYRELLSENFIMLTNTKVTNRGPQLSSLKSLHIVILNESNHNPGEPLVLISSLSFRTLYFSQK